MKLLKSILWPLLLFILVSCNNAVETNTSVEKPVEVVKEKLNIILIDKIVMGATLQGKWLDADHTKEKIIGGEKYNIYDNHKKITEDIGKKVEIAEPTDTPVVFMKSNNKYKIAISGEYEPIQRPITYQALDNKRYMNICSEILNKKNIDTLPKIMQNFKVDMEGDGIDEVLLNISNMNYIHPQMKLEKGHYSIIVLRKLIDSEVKNIVIFETIGEDIKNGNIENNQIQIIGNIEGIIDLNKDGVMEIIVGSRYYEGQAYSILEVKKEKVAEVLFNGWGA